MTPAPGGPDDKLIRLCDEFVELERLLTNIRNVEFRHDWAAADVAAAPLEGRLEPLFEAICTAKARTLDGLRARARMMVAFQGEADDFPHGPWPAAMIAALLADLTAPAVDADAELIAACEAHDRFQSWRWGLCGCGPEKHLHIMDDRQRDAVIITAPNSDVFVNRTLNYRATTIEGLRARALSIAWNHGEHLRQSTDQGDEMVEALIIDLIGDIWPGENAPPSDAALIDLCKRYAALERKFQHIHNAQHPNDDDAAEAAGNLVRAEMKPLLRQICETRACGLGGLIARASALRACRTDRGDECSPEDDLLRAMLRDLPEPVMQSGAA